MTLTPDERSAIIDYRIERAKSAYDEALYVAKGNYWNLAANRLYYSIFYICEALLLKNKIAANTHMGVNIMMNKHFVKTGLLTPEEASLMGDVLQMRQTGDYEDLYDFNEEKIVPYFDKVRYFIEKIETLIR